MSGSETHQSPPITVLVVDDHQTVADALALAITHEDDLTCVGTARSVAEAMTLAELHRPDAVVMDVHLPDGDGLAAAARLTERWPGTRIVVLTAFVSQALLQRAVAAGASALLPKDGALSEVLHSVRTASRGEFMVHPTLVKHLGRGTATPSPEHPVFTHRETQVLQMLADGSDTVVIAQSLGITLLTCRGYIKNILVKLDAHTQLEAVVTAHRRGLIHLGGPH